MHYILPATLFSERTRIFAYHLCRTNGSYGSPGINYVYTQWTVYFPNAALWGSNLAWLWDVDAVSMPLSFHIWYLQQR